MTKSINQQMQDLHVQARVAQTEGIKQSWDVAKKEIDTLYEMADDIEADIAKHPAMPQHEKDSLLREIENSAWGAHLPIKIELGKNGKLGSSEHRPNQWMRKI